MEPNERLGDDQKPKRRVRWASAGLAGFVVGIIFLVFVRGLPWFSSGVISPGVMGRQMPNTSPDDGVGLALGAALLHVIVSIAYTLVLAPLIHRLNLKPAIACGAAVGFGLYLLNYLIFTRIYPQYAGQQEIGPIFTHVIFGMAAAAAYKGLAKRGLERQTRPVIP
jgi:hypothetical protein